MKKLVSVICVLTLIVGIFAVSAVSTSAVESDQKEIEVSSGDEVTYTLTLGSVPEKIIGCDFSFYYDSSLFELVSVADFNDKTSEEEWTPVINTNLDGEVRGNWSILNGVDFTSERNFLTLKLKAKSDGSGQVSYFIRYMYDNNIFNSDDKPQITEYKFTCTVLVNGEPYIEKGDPVLNVDEPQKSGLFVNSVTGDSKDADANVPGTVVKKNDTNAAVTPQSGGSASGNNSNNAAADNNNANNANNSNNANNANNANNNSANKSDAAPAATTADGYYVVATDASGNIVATADQAPVSAANTTDGGSKGGASPVLWIIIALVVLAGGGAIAYFAMKKKSAGAAQPAENTAIADETASVPEAPVEDPAVVSADEPKE
jgi:hypothetical protein